MRWALGNVDGALYLLFLGFGQLWHGDGEHAVVHFGGNVFFHHIVGQGVGLLVIGVAELAAQVVLLFVLVLVLHLVFDGYAEVAVGVEWPVRPLALCTRNGVFGYISPGLMYPFSRFRVHLLGRAGQPGAR